MRRLGMQIGLVFVFCFSLGISFIAPSQAASQRTKVGITFVNQQVAARTHGGATDKVTIPNGKTPYRLHTTNGGAAANGQASQTATRPKSKGTAAHVVATILATGRLPQTNEVQSFLVHLVGCLLLIVLGLAALVYYQARQLGKKE